MKVWVCQVRREAFVGGESQRCRHNTKWPITRPDQIDVCGVMVLVGGEPVEWCVVHGAMNLYSGCNCLRFNETEVFDPCQFESQIRVGP